MEKTNLLLIIAMSLFILGVYLPVHAQSTTTTTGKSTATSQDETSVVSVNASVTAQVTNQTLKEKDVLLRSAVTGFLNSGPNILKTKDGGQDVVTKIVNKVNEATQNVQGTEATNAIIGVEISKALKSSVLLSKSTQASSVTIDISATCKSMQTKSISCQNSITIR